tara:strand:+ start:211 stop:1551 length:1341 start_codon:yes stop_codon:yes gene_type:complete
MSSETPAPSPPRGRLTILLSNAPGSVFALFVILASFSTYFCMYAFRKPFSAAGYDGLVFLDTTIDLKTALVISQIIGYVLSKVIGIKICSEVTRGRRALALVTLIGIAQLSLLLFAVLPNDLKVLAIFFNGLPLGMVWGMVVWYLEGRRTSEMLLAGLSCSFIIASGVVKDVGRWVMTSMQVDQFWMPFVTGLCFLPPFLLAVWLLNQLPDPSAEDIAARVERTTMNRGQRWQFIRQFLPAMLLLVITYFFLTAYRDYRDNFGVEIFEALGYGADQSLVFTRSEIWVAVGVLGTLAALNVIRDNRRGLIGAFGIMVSGVALLGGATLMLDAGRIDGMTWMILTGLGSYLAYVPYGSVLFDRLIASTRATGTAVFAIYVADAIGYGGAITVLLTKDLLATDVSRLDFFRGLTYFMALLGTILLAGACALLLLRHEHHPGQLPVDTSQ